METVASGDAGDPDWWKHTIVYQIYPRSFQDSDGDGVGDLRGIISRLDHFNYMDIGTIWLSPFYPSPMVDFGYDISDFTDVDPVFGTIQDFDRLIEEAHKRGIRVLVDFVPNHSSNEHLWFKESRKGKDNPYADYYIWDDGKLLPDGSRQPPNNWVSVFSGDSWTWDDQRQQFYYHQFTVEQPDLNYRNPKVREEMKNVLRFWLDRGADGFRIDAIGCLFEVEDLSIDEPRSQVANVSSMDYLYLDHIYTTHLPEIHEVIREWRDVFDEYERKTGKHPFAVTEIYDETYVESMKYYHSGADIPFNFDLIGIDKTCDGACIKSYVSAWLQRMPQGKWPNFVIGNHDRQRITRRKGLGYADAMNVLLLTLPGTPTTYYGEEIAMVEIELSFEQVQDPWGKSVGPELFHIYNRDGCRSPMQWSDQRNSGFSSGPSTWLPVNPDYKTRNVEAQKIQGSNSHLEIYRFVAKLRRQSAFQSPDIHFPADTSSGVIAYARYNAHDPETPSPVYLVAVNAGGVPSTDDLEVRVLGRHFKTGVVILDTEGQEEGRAEEEVALKDIRLRPGQALILKLNQRSNDEL